MSWLIRMSRGVMYLGYYGRWVRILELNATTRYRGPTGCCVRKRRDQEKWENLRIYIEYEAPFKGKLRLLN